jgi:hypothetical protein
MKRSAKRQSKKAQLLPGRPTDCTPETIKKIADLISVGNYATVAARVAGIADSTYYDWLKRGRNGEYPFSEFSDAIKKAEADSETYRVSRIVQASAEHWQAAAWLLERKIPERWGRRDRQPVPWQDEVLQMLREGKVTLDDVRESLGDDLASEFFKFAGAAIAGPDEAAPQSE